jgi:hypothetical protein
MHTIHSEKTSNGKAFPGMLALITASVLSGCGPNIIDDSPKETSIRTPDSFQYVMSGEFSCPTEANITPYEDRVFDGSQRYTVCSHRTTTSRIRISGYSSTDSQLCVYPLEFLDDTHFVYKMSVNGLPLYTCYNSQTTPQKDFDFQTMHFDGLVIVDQADQADMSRCLMNGANCPTHSLGRFR